MIRQDYILRLIQQFAEVIARIAGLKQAGRHEEARAILDGEVQRLVGLSPTLVRSLGSKELIRLMSIGKTLDLDRCIVLAHYLKETAEIDEALGQVEESRSGYTRSLDLFLEVFVDRDDTYLRERLPAIESLILRLEPYELPAGTLLRLVHLYEKTGHYAHAEDRLFELLETSERDEEPLAEGVRFYERMLARTDAELERGNLPREEVIQGIEELRRAHEHPGGQSD